MGRAGAFALIYMTSLTPQYLQAWLMHCHIAWHTSEGFGVQLLERESEMRSSPGVLDYDAVNSTCAAWNSYAAAQDVVQHDSGI